MTGDIKQVPLNTLLDAWIEVMRRVVDSGSSFAIDWWVHSCDSPACGGGYLAVSDFWRGLNGCRNRDGAPAAFFDGLMKVGANAIHVAIDAGQYSDQYVHQNLLNLTNGSEIVFGGRYENIITAQDFLDALIRFRETGSPDFI